MATRGRKSKDKPTNQLLEALRFVALAQRDEGPSQHRHCRIKEGWIAASDGILTAGAKVDAELDACPQTRRLLAALERCGEGVAITQLDETRLSVKSGALRAVVPCIDPELIGFTWADPPIAPLTPAFLAGVKAIEHIASDTGPNVQSCSLLIAGPTISATNGQVLAEYWHGNELPPYFVIPKSAANVLNRCAKTPIGFGFNGRSATFHYDDGSWLKTQLFDDKWPNIAKVFEKEKPGNNVAIPAGLFDAMALIGDFSDCGQVEFCEGLLKTVNKEGAECAEHDVKDMLEGARFSIKNLELLKPIAKTLNVDLSCPAAYFYGQNLRGAISFYGR